MKVISIDGFILSSINYQESSKILNILTKEYGIIGVISKGCKSPKSKLRNVSENYTYATFHMYYNEGKLSTLIGADPINYLLNIRSDIIKISFINYLSELSKEVYRESSNSMIYDLLISAILKIEEGFNPIVITNILELKYLYFIGVGINLDECVVCGRKSILTFSFYKGGYVCSFCATNEKIFDEKVLKMLKLYYYVDINKITELKINSNVINEVNMILTEYYSHFTGLYLKSKKFLEEIKGK